MDNKVCLAFTVFNRGHLLKNCLERLLQFQLPDEIIVVDDGGTDNTKSIVESFSNRLPIKYIYNNNPSWTICSFARNIVIKNTDCELVIFCEPELLFIDDTIKLLLEEFYNNPNHVITAGVIYHQQERCKTTNKTIENPEQDLKSSKVKYNSLDGTISYNHDYVQVLNWQAPYIMLFEKKYMVEIGGYDELFEGEWGAEDWDTFTRLRIKCGVNQVISPKIKVIHQWHPTLPPNIQARALKLNEKRFFDKKLNVDGVEDKNNPNLVANQGFEWGVIKK